MSLKPANAAREASVLASRADSEKSLEFLHPSLKEASIPLPYPAAFGIWYVRFLWSLEFGIWNFPLAGLVTIPTGFRWEVHVMCRDYV
jgi:hypothetical protein